MKPHGAIWLGLGTESYSLRDYQRLGEIWRRQKGCTMIELSIIAARLTSLVLTLLFWAILIRSLLEMG